MKGILKVLGIVVGAVLLLFVGTLVVIGFIIDPNDYKDDITAAVKNATGRDLTLAGDLQLELFPTIRLAVAGASLSNAPGFGNEPMAQIANAELRVALLPLLGKRVEVSEARLTGLVLNLARDARGRNNWQDLGGNGAATETPATPSSGGAPGVDLGVGAIQIADARVTWNDASTGNRWELTDFGLRAEGFGPGKSFPLEMQFALAGADLSLEVAAETRATLTLAQNEYKLENLEVTIDGSGADWPGGASQAKLGVDSLVANLGAESLELGGLTADFLGIEMSGSLAGQKLMSDLTLTGAVDIHEFEPRELLTGFGVNVQTADDDVLTRASAKANLLYTSRQVGLREMQLNLDDSALTGRVALEGERITYDLAVNDINVDRYLPPAEEGGSADEGSLDEVDLPLDVLRTLDARGQLKFGRTKFSGLTLTNTVFALNAGNGTVRLTPSTDLYGGKLTGEIRIQVQDKAARVNVQQTLDDVNIAALGQDLLGSQDITGTGDVRLNLTTAGSNVGQMRRDLDGDVAFTVVNGSLEGIDLWYELRRARARLDKAPVPERGNAPRRTTFSSLAATGVVEDALLTNRDLTGKLDFMTVTGAGTVNLLDNMVDFDLKATFTDGETLQSDPEMAKYAGSSIPLRVTGTIDEPSVLPDFAAIARARVTQETKDAVEEKTEEVRDRLRDRLRDALKR
jgi:AsmA protein